MSLASAFDSNSWTSWTWQQQNAVRDFSTLQAHCPWLDSEAAEVFKHYKVQITPYYLGLLDRSLGAHDPLAQIVIPKSEELNVSAEELVDPIGDNAILEGWNTRPTEQVVHRYQDRALLFLTLQCAAYCRYCFRRESLNESAMFNRATLENSLLYLEQTQSLREVILSGGDALILSDSRLSEVLQRLDLIPHVRMLRIHSKVPIFNPFRITQGLCDVLSRLKKPFTFITHVTHPREVTPDFQQAMARLREAGVILLNQTPLVARVNDSVEILSELSYRLFECGVLPHYLHLLDRARGTSHFRVTHDQAQKILGQMRGHVSGHLIPRLIWDLPGGWGKVALDEGHFEMGVVRSPLFPNHAVPVPTNS